MSAPFPSVRGARASMEPITIRLFGLQVSPCWHRGVFLIVLDKSDQRKLAMWGQVYGQAIAEDLGARQTTAVPPAGRFALVVGNSDYEHAPSLPNGRNDAAAISGALQNLGFGVSLTLDVSHDAMRKAIQQFSRSLRPGDVSLSTMPVTDCRRMAQII
ncbi:MAG: caspase family protein [Mesorhizobium sp.]|nr:MAG: caspase family protein [Mesorhizobium sp.]